MLRTYDSENKVNGIINTVPRVYNSQQDKTLILENRVPDLRDTANLINNTATNIAENVTKKLTPVITPRYRGKTTIPDHDNTGIINGNVMNFGDRILYVGIQEGTWTPNRVYVWDRDNIWIMLAPPTETNRQNANYYLEANGDVTEGAPEAVFSLAQIRSLVASSIFANLIGAKQIFINTDGFIQSDATDPATGRPLFLIKADGFMEAIGATFERIRITGDSHFEGDIISGQIHSSNNRIGQDLPPKTFSSSENARDVHRYFGYGQDTYQTATLGSFPITGTWGGRPVSNIVIRTYRAGIGQSIFTQYIIDITLTDTTPASIVTRSWIDSSGYRDTLGASFSIVQGISGAIFRLFNIPVGDSQSFINSLPLGQVYRQGSQLHVKL